MSIFDLLKHDADLHNKLSNKQKTTNGINETIGNTNGNINTKWRKLQSLMFLY